MKKIPTLLDREFGPDVDCPARPVVPTSLARILVGTGVAYKKFDGEPILVEAHGTTSVVYRRRTLRPDNGADGTQVDGHGVYDVPDRWKPAQPEPRNNGKWPGWIRVTDEDSRFDQIREAVEATATSTRDGQTIATVNAAGKPQVQQVDDLKTLDPGTYELIGPKVQGNPHDVDTHLLVPHIDTQVGRTVSVAHDVTAKVDDPPERTFEGLRQWLADHPDVEGLVWWETTPQGPEPVAKIKRTDFGMEWG